MDIRDGMNVTFTAFDSVNPSVTVNKASTGRNADVSNEGHDTETELEMTAVVEPREPLDAVLNKQE